MTTDVKVLECSPQNWREHERHLWETAIKSNVPDRILTFACPGRPTIEMVKRKICANFDTVCLEGGCGYCEQGRWRSIEAIRLEAAKRDDKHDTAMLKSFEWGRTRHFCNAPVKYSDGTTKQSRHEADHAAIYG